MLNKKEVNNKNHRKNLSVVPVRKQVPIKNEPKEKKEMKEKKKSV